MARDFRTVAPRLRDLRSSLASGLPWVRKGAIARLRLLLAILLVMDVVVAAVVLKPWGGSAQDLDRQLASLREQVAERRRAVERLRAVVSKVETARQEAERFVNGYFLERRTVSSAVLSELDKLAQLAGIRQKEGSYLFEPVEGSYGLSMMTINASYEGTYADLIRFMNLLDRSPRLLIVSDLQAAPQASGLALNITMKLNAFVREGPGGAPAEPAQGEAAGEAARP